MTSAAISAGVSRRAKLPLRSVQAAVALLDEGCTIPFIARYRKDATGGLSDDDLRRLGTCLEEVTALEDRRAAIRTALEKAGKLTEELARRLDAIETLRDLEDLWAPFKTKRRTKATIALERGLGPLASALRDPSERRPPSAVAVPFVDAAKGVASVEEALEGAADILVEELATDPDLRRAVRESRAAGWLAVKAARGKSEEAEKSVYRELLGLRVRVAAIKPHRVLAIDRGEREGLLSVGVEGDDAREEREAARRLVPRPGRPADGFLREAALRAVKERVGPAGENDVRRSLTESAEARAIDIFRENLRQLLLAPPLKRKPILGLDPGFTSGVKCAVVDAHGAYVDSATIHPHTRGRSDEATAAVKRLVEAHGVEVAAIGNGTACRETLKFARQAFASRPGKPVAAVVVSEAGASVYSASEVASEEHPDLDVTVRGALSIARRVQDPLAELVKIDPWHLGVGQYQHDVDEGRLRKALEGVVERAVNEVGVDVNRASRPLLERVSGITPRIARAIVSRRAEGGPFRRREDLLRVPGIGAKVFEQAAGFLRVPESPEPLDRTAVHPESYAIARKVAAALGRPVEELAGQAALLGDVDPARFVEGAAGVETVADILRELAQPGRDPRGEAESFEYTEGVEEIGALKPGMVVTGTVTNVTDFGAFVDVGVHKDGLLHVSKLGRRVDHPSDVLRLGQPVRVRVEAVDLERERISLALEGGGGGGAPLSVDASSPRG